MLEDTQAAEKLAGRLIVSASYSDDVVVLALDDGMEAVLRGYWRNDNTAGIDLELRPPSVDGFFSPGEIAAGVSMRGGWTRDQLAKWGIPWPPPKGWRRDLEARWHKATAGGTRPAQTTTTTPTPTPHSPNDPHETPRA